MHADFASMQMYRPERGELWLLANRGFSLEAANFWQRVTPKSTTSCGIALGSTRRVIVADAEEGVLVNGGDLEMCRRAGVRAMQCLSTSENYGYRKQKPCQPS
jgi:hypothetical protein